jgi:hypothetical protein
VPGDNNVVSVVAGAGTRFTSLSAAEYGASVARERTALRRARRLALGLSDGQVDASFGCEPPLPDGLAGLAVGRLVVLTGPLGSGKSDLADRWLIAAAERYETGGPVPLWVSASEVSGRLESRVAEALGRADVMARTGVDLVVDGLDERLDNAGSLLEQARGLAAAFPLSRVVLSAREGVAVPAGVGLPVGPWDRDLALGLVAAVAGRGTGRQISYGWPPSLLDAVRRPLFALLAGSFAGDADVPATPAGLVDRAVRQAVPTAASSPALRRLAVERIRTGLAVDLHDVGGEAVEALIGSRLLVVDEGRAVFALPLIEQWFAARAVLLGEVPVQETIASLAEFGRWRYVLSVAVASGQPATVNPVMEAVASWNPGAAGWLAHEAISSGLSHGASEQVGNWQQIGVAVRAATAAWAIGLGPAARFAVPMRHMPGTRDDPLSAATLAVRVDEERVGLGWAPSRQVAGPVSYDPPHPMAERRDATMWVGLRSGGSPPDRNWPWALTLNEMSRGFVDALVQDLPLVTPETGVVVAEWAHARAVALLDAAGRRLADGGLLPLVDELIDHAGGAAGVAFGRLRMTADELALLRRVLALDPEAAVRGPWPDVPWSERWPDREDAPGLLARVRAVYRGAVAAYREIADGPLAAFGDALGTRCLLPATVTGRLTTPSDAAGEERPYGAVLSYELRPVGVPGPGGRVGTDSVEIDQGASLFRLRDESWWERASAEAAAYSAVHPDAAVFAHWTASETVLEVWGRRPSTGIALGWIHEDLKPLGWTDGTRRPEPR